MFSGRNITIAIMKTIQRAYKVIDNAGIKMRTLIQSPENLGEGEGENKAYSSMAELKMAGRTL